MGNEKLKTKIRDAKFIQHYLKNGNNATRAYLAVKPNVSPVTAGTEGYKLLQKPQIQNKVREALEQYNVSYGYVTSVLKRIVDREEDGNVVSATNSLIKLLEIADRHEEKRREATKPREVEWLREEVDIEDGDIDE